MPLFKCPSFFDDKQYLREFEHSRLLIALKYKFCLIIKSKVIPQNK